MDGTTLARYRRLVGMVARRNLHQMISTATQRVVIHRKQNESVMKIQADSNGEQDWKRVH
uniref:Uncharacterized protein n=1 Tax=Globisporangium ultimum (strain ATCC 200006 / CBS 805.95 / DAOM BR144) TaxID=431595 RepID=K3WFZ2_GLOUD